MSNKNSVYLNDKKVSFEFIQKSSKFGLKNSNESLDNSRLWSRMRSTQSTKNKVACSIPKISTGTIKPIRAFVMIIVTLSMFIIAPMLSLRSSSFENQNVNIQNGYGVNQASAESVIKFACGDGLGYGMKTTHGWHTSFLTTDLVADNVPGRLLTAQDMFGKVLVWPVYYGEGDGDDFATSVKRSYPEGITFDEEATKRIEGIRTTTNCTITTTLSNLASSILNVSNVIASITSEFASFAFSTNIICDNANSDSWSCFNLLALVGGDGSGSGGLIGSLTNSFYMPLLVIVALAVGVWILINGLVKRKFRESLWGLIWATASVVIGLALLLNPALLAQAPASVSNTLSGCVISAFGGDNCMGGSTSPVDYSGNTSNKICRTDSGAAGPEHSMQLIASSLTCSIWKAFVLEPYAQGQFGTNFSDLDTSDPAARGSQLAKGIVDGNKFCVSMRTIGAPKSMYQATLKTGGGDEICNLALYQLYLTTNVSSNGGGIVPVESGKTVVDGRWYNLIAVMASNDTSWGNWSADGAWHLLGSAGVSLVSTVFGSALIITTAIFAVMFYILSIILMAFAPIFFLVGVHPGKGRDLLKGWAEMVLSNIFKYVVSSLFLIVSLALYGGVLGASTNSFTTLLFVIVLTLALFLYRKEMLEMLGKVNMGGARIGESISKFAKDKASDSSRLAKVATGSAVGSAIAGGGVMTGMREGATRELKRPGGLLGQVGSGAFHGMEYANKDNRQKFQNVVSEIEEKELEKLRELQEADTEFNRASTTYENIVNSITGMDNELDALTEEIDKADPARWLDRLMVAGGAEQEYALAVQAQNDVDEFNFKIEEARANGDRAAIDENVSLRNDAAERRQSHINNVKDAGSFEELNDEYQERLNVFETHVDSYDRISAQKEMAESALSEQAEVMKFWAEEYGSKVQAAAGAAAAKDAISRAEEGLRAGEILRSSKIDKFSKEAEEARTKAVQDTSHQGEALDKIVDERVSSHNKGLPVNRPEVSYNTDRKSVEDPEAGKPRPITIFNFEDDE